MTKLWAAQKREKIVRYPGICDWLGKKNGSVKAMFTAAAFPIAANAVIQVLLDKPAGNLWHVAFAMGSVGAVAAAYAHERANVRLSRAKARGWEGRKAVIKAQLRAYACIVVPTLLFNAAAPAPVKPPPRSGLSTCMLHQRDLAIPDARICEAKPL